MSASKLISNWTFNKRKLPEPFQEAMHSARFHAAGCPGFYGY